jgi:hypothetical protein
VRAYALERLADSGEDAQVRDALTAYYLTFTETADPLLRSADQVRWFRELTAEQDNAHAALRRAIARRDADTALRMVRAMAYFWVQRGHGEGETLIRDALALDPPPLTERRTAEARAICALLAAGWSWDIESVREPLTQAIAALSPWSADFETFHPIAALVEPVLAQFDGDNERALAIFERYARARDPWLRGMGRLYTASYGSTVGRPDGAEEACIQALAAFRGLGETWGTAITLTQLAEFVELRADHAAAIAALEEAAAIGRELGSWGDMAYVEGKLAVIRARTGDLPRARAELDRVEREAAERSGYGDTDRWVAFMRAELAWREDDLDGVARCCLAVLASMTDMRAGWWESLRAQIKARMAMVALARRDLPRCADLLGQALQAAQAWVDHASLAVVLDAVAAYVLRRGGPGDAELAATLLGAAHWIRGAFDESSLDAPAARAAARAALGTQAFTAAYDTGRAAPGYAEASSRARAALDVRPALRPAAVGADRERGEHREDAQRPQQRPEHRRTGRPVPGQQGALGLGQVGDGVDVHERLQPARHGGRLHQQVAAEDQREEGKEAVQLHALRCLHEQPDERGEPAHGHREQQEQQAAGRGGERTGLDAEPHDHPEAERDRHRDRVPDDVAEHRARQRRPPGDRQAAEPVEDAGGDVLVEHQPGAQSGEHHAEHQDAWQRELQVAVGAAGQGAAEHVREQHQVHDRLQAQAEQVLGIRP